jgi:hypothetical protein
MAFRKSFVGVMVLFICCLNSAFAQNAGIQSSARESVQGMTGQVEIAPDPAVHEVVVAFTSNESLNKGSNQIVFVLQGNLSNYPTAWSGPARVLVSPGLLVVAPSPDQKQNPTLAFKFAGQPVPASLQGWTMESFEVFGIARYGETYPLSRDQLTELETTGKYTKSADGKYRECTGAGKFC